MKNICSEKIVKEKSLKTKSYLYATGMLMSLCLMANFGQLVSADQQNQVIPQQSQMLNQGSQASKDIVEDNSEIQTNIPVNSTELSEAKEDLVTSQENASAAGIAPQTSKFP